jgi:hypothetical protein
MGGKRTLMTPAYSSVMPRTPEHYREEADRCRKMAQDLNGETKTNLLDVARQYDKLADEAATKR